MVALAEPVLKKHRMKLGIENHKGWRAAEQAAWMKRLGSEWVGVCLDFGNNLSLCEDPMETARTLAPYVFYAHIKDMAVEEYEEGFLLSEVPLGEGLLDLKQIVQLLRQKDPNMIFNLEMITRDPQGSRSHAEVLGDFDDAYSPLPGRDSGGGPRAREEPPQEAAATSHRPEHGGSGQAEDDQRQCIAHARQNLGL
jgi:sugar phosphate isomerase/epimerase